ncbi:Pal1-domain-containing protein [Xylariaceae sp. FL0016]|nr:Pal1-domain-containing protein [Xylariaceae sp. FL0016]
MSSSQERRSPTAEEIFDNLTLDDGNVKKVQSRSGPPNGRPMNRPPGGGAPRGRGPPPGSHRPTRSQEEALRARRMQAAANGDKPFAGDSPQKAGPRPRRNSESSIMEKPMTDEERKMREMRRRDRERRHRDGKPRTGRKLDIIDQLDATSIYGTGLFHHDGPFDACNPHRNRKGSRRAPMQAFAKDSANNSLGGAGPINKRPDHKQFMGQEPHEATSMYAGENLNRSERPQKEEMGLYDPKQRTDYEHGEETQGLGTSTFLEGAPASKTAISRNQSEQAESAMENGLGRKKSVVQRFRSIKRAPRQPREYGDRVTSPDAYPSPTSALPTGGSTGERNPFFQEYDKDQEQITVKRKDSNPLSPISPLGHMHGGTLERRSTTDATMDSELTQGQSKQAGNGFLSRVKSLKGGRRQRPEVPAKDYIPTPAPGTAA